MPAGRFTDVKYVKTLNDRYPTGAGHTRLDDDSAARRAGPVEAADRSGAPFNGRSRSAAARWAKDRRQPAVRRPGESRHPATERWPAQNI